uniref:Uncharacterized protein n=1 Tax=Knipowitschia caucasica TaxID=637954 RepID=A0AAV2MJT3_KNICA
MPNHTPPHPPRPAPHAERNVPEQRHPLSPGSSTSSCSPQSLTPPPPLVTNRHASQSCPITTTQYIMRVPPLTAVETPPVQTQIDSAGRGTTLCGSHQCHRDQRESHTSNVSLTLFRRSAPPIFPGTARNTPGPNAPNSPPPLTLNPTEAHRNTPPAAAEAPPKTIAVSPSALLPTQTKPGHPSTPNINANKRATPKRREKSARGARRGHRASQHFNRHDTTGHPRSTVTPRPQAPQKVNRASTPHRSVRCRQVAMFEESARVPALPRAGHPGNLRQQLPHSSPLPTARARFRSFANTP